MNWVNVESLEELKKLGKFRDVSNKVKNDVGTIGKINRKGWQTLYDSIIIFRESVNKFTKELEENSVNPDEYFVSKANEYIFYLLELEGDLRANKLGVTKRHFTNKRIAKQWKNAILKEIQPKVCKNSRANEAIKALNSIYESMAGGERK